MNTHGKRVRHERRHAARAQHAATEVVASGVGATEALWLDQALAGAPMPPLLIAVGLGDGDLQAIDVRSSDTRVIALEPDPLAARSFLSRPDARRWRESGRLLYLTGPDFAGADQAWRCFPHAPDAFKILVHPALPSSSERVVDALRIIKRIVFGVRANAEARRRFAPVYLTNVLRNAPAMAAGRDVRALAGAFAGVPAVIAGAGPSLDQALGGLRGIDGGALLIAVDTALRPLLHAGIAPALVVSADPSAMNARHLQALPDCPDTWLVAESALAPHAAANFHDRTLWFRLAAHQPWPWLNHVGLDVGRVEMWGSVLTAAFQVACLAGCDPIVIVGADLAYTNGRPYCRGTTYEFDWAAATAGGRTLTDVWMQSTSPRDAISVPDMHGAGTVTTRTLVSFRDWMVATAKRSGRRVVNASGAGILFGDGIQQGRLSDAAPIARELPAIGKLSGVVPDASTPPRVMAALHEARTALEGAGGAPGVIEEWLAFAGGPDGN